MKKLLLAFAILGFVACGGNETETTPAADTTAVTVDTAAAPVVDTTAPAVVDSAAAAPAADTTKK